MLSTYIIIWIEKNGNKMSKALTFIDPTKESLQSCNSSSSVYVGVSSPI